MSYITEDEIPAYCGLSSGVTMDHAEAASVLIDAYLGISLLPKEHVEKVPLEYKRSLEETRGKLYHFPRIRVDSVKAKVSSVFGTQELSLDADCLDFDGEESPYFSFVMPRKLMFQKAPKSILVSYVSGYENIPEQVKRACGLLACNICQMGGTLRWKSRDDYDIKVTLGNDGVMSPEVKSVLAGVVIR